jgi:hypothetical protein
MGIKDDKPTIKTRSYKVGGDNVVQLFPQGNVEQKTKLTADESKLTHMQKLLRFQFKNIKEGMENLSSLQRECAKTEEMYDDLLKVHAERVGVENLTKTMLDYSSHVEAVATEDGLELRYKDE